MSLLEVLVSIVVLAIGLLGVAMLVVVSMQQSQAAATRLQANLVAQSIMDRMSANIPAVWMAGYDGDHAGASAGPEGCEVAVGGCDYDALAQRDVAQWSAEIAHMLPAGASGTIACTPRSSPPSGNALAVVPAYNGYCDIALRWNESAAEGGVAEQEVAWRFMP